MEESFVLPLTIWVAGISLILIAAIVTDVLRRKERIGLGVQLGSLIIISILIFTIGWVFLNLIL